MGDVVQFRKTQQRVGGFEIVTETDFSAGDDGPGYKFIEREVAKSSTSVLNASVCQGCGCKLDGKIESMRPNCACRCHKDGIR